MLARPILVVLGCLLAWFVVLPIVVVLGGGALFLYATMAELTSLIAGDASRTVDPATLRLTARKICAGYSFTQR